MCVDREWNTHCIQVYELKWKLSFVSTVVYSKWIFAMIAHGPRFFFLLCCILKNVSRFLLRRFLLRRRMIITFGQFIVHYLRSYFLWFVKLYNKLFQHEVTIKSYKWNIYIFYMKLMQMCIISLMAIFNTMHFMDFNAAIVQKLFFSIILGLKDLIQFKVKKWLGVKSLPSLMLITIIIKQTLVASWKLRVMSISYHYA